MSKRRVGSVFVVLGAVLMLSALLLFVYNQREAEKAGDAAGAALSQLQEAMNENKPPMLELSEEGEGEAQETSEPEMTIPTELTVVNIDGYDYIGYLSIPYYEIELPIMDRITEDRLHVAPCLQYGSPLEDDAVIAGHNYKTHFLCLHEIEVGEYLTFTTMSGYEIEYGVVEVRIITPTNVAAVQNSDHDLVLYTCTSGGQSRVAVFCDRLEEIPAVAEQKDK